MYIRIIQDLGTGSTEGPKLQVFYVIDAPDGLYGAFENHKEAEEHLMREVSLSVNGAREYINNYARRPGSP